jgi:hypothetical protein
MTRGISVNDKVKLKINNNDGLVKTTNKGCDKITEDHSLEVIHEIDEDNSNTYISTIHFPKGFGFDTER